MKLNNEALARELAADSQMPLNRAREAVSFFFENIAANLSEGHEISIAGFGKFTCKDKPERQARNPRTGEMLTIPAKRVLKFTPAKALKERVL